VTAVLVAMSGGVDSSVAAAQLLADGHDVIGVTLKLWEGPGGSAPTAGCCTVSDAEDARRVAAQLGIPYYVLDHTDVFMDGVVDRFIDDYMNGLTPNPCIECNRTVKFSELMRRAEEFGCDVIATGHYAQVRHERDAWRLFRGNDPNKDQSYVLSMLTQAQLSRIRFPVGALTKPEVRRLAAELDLRTAGKAESQDICFVGDGDYRDFLATHAPVGERTGDIVDTEGTVVGVHDGVTNFTIGQRRGLGIALGEPRFVTGIDPATATVTIGRREDLQISEFVLRDLTWVAEQFPDGTRVEVQYRAHGAARPARLFADGRRAILRFETPQVAVAPGQTAALYVGDEVVGGGIIVGTAGVMTAGPV
jgi:tRNA-specific 2-thiouridylase